MRMHHINNWTALRISQQWKFRLWSAWCIISSGIVSDSVLHTFCTCVCKRCNNARCNMTGKCSTIFWMNKIYKGLSEPHVHWKSNNITDVGSGKYYHAVLHRYHYAKFTLQQKIQHLGQSVTSGAPCPKCYTRFWKFNCVDIRKVS